MNRNYLRAMCVALSTVAALVLTAVAPAQADSEAYVLPNGVVSDHVGDGAWCWFQDPRAVHHVGAVDATYVGFVTSDGDIVVTSSESGTGRAHRFTVARALQRDDHASPGLLVLPDGRIAVFYSRHNDRQMRFRISVHPEDITVFGPEQTVAAPIGGFGVTYANPIYLPSENRVYVFFRGDDALPQVTWSDPTLKTWSTPRTFIVPTGHTAGQRPYVKYSSNGSDTISMAYTDGHPKEEERTSIYHMILKQGAFQTVDGQPLGRLGNATGSDAEPVRTADVPRIYDRDTATLGNAWVWSTAIDAQGHPVIGFSSFPSRDDHRYWYARWDGQAWQSRQIAEAGGAVEFTGQEPQYSGGLDIDQSDPSVLYTSRLIGGQWEIQQWRTHDGGMSFDDPTDITAGSTGKNMRPVVPSGPPGQLKVLWMNGQYRSWYSGAFRTSVRSYTEGRAPASVDSSISSTLVDQGQLVTVAATVRQGHSGGGVPYARTHLIRVIKDKTTTVIASKVTDGAGVVRYDVRASDDARYEVHAEQSTWFGAAESRSVAYQVRHVTQARISLRTDTRNRRVRLYGRAVDLTTGRVMPRARMEFWQSVNGGAWTRRTYQTGDANGLTSALLTVPPGTRLQVRVARQGVHLPAFSIALHSGIYR